MSERERKEREEEMNQQAPNLEPQAGPDWKYWLAKFEPSPLLYLVLGPNQDPSRVKVAASYQNIRSKTDLCVRVSFEELPPEFGRQERSRKYHT